MKNDAQERVVVVGFGWVGQANALALKILGYDVAYFDPATPPRHYTAHAAVYDSLEKLSDVRQNDTENTWYIVCVGDRVSEEGVQDISSIEKALQSLKGVKGSVVLRSTIIPDTLAKLSFDYYMPEFLHEKLAVEESITPYLFVLGAREGVRPEPSFFGLWRSRARKAFNGTPEEASFIKYLSNLWNSVRIAFVNEFGDAIGHPSDQKQLEKIQAITSFLFDDRAYLRYGRGFGGHCLPKDTRAFLKWYEKGSTKLPLLAGTYTSNTYHQELEKKYPLMPEWYSEWPQRHISGKRALSELWYVTKKYAMNPSLMWKRI
jgi:UDPglucose 6-dehydrogenase